MIAQIGVDLGIVTRRDDPDGLGRIKIRVNGVIEPETPNWVEELGGMSGGGAQRGTFDPPDVGATVGVVSHRGDPDRLFFLRGPYGAPGGTSDVPDGGVVEGNDRGLVATEDEVWLIQRDSQAGSAPQRFRINHKGSSCEIAIEGDDNVRLVRLAASEAAVRGTEYRVAEKQYLLSLHTALASFAGTAKTAADPVVVAAATKLELDLAAISGSDLINDSTKYLSTKLWLE